ncbi:MAG: hypothetical protein JJE50_00110 [Actinomycetales bacterium]|nr:hypothetical protein [Actinomycetales bacterium]
MSAVPARAPQIRPTATPSWRPRLRIVRAPAPVRTHLPFVLLCLSILGGALLGALMLNTSMAATAYELHDAEISLARLSESEQVLAAQADQLSSAPQLAARATAIGMVPAEGLSYIRLSDGSIAGPVAGLIGGE